LSPRLRFRRPRRLTGWAAIVPLVAAGAGVMFATSAQTSQGTDLRSSGRTDLVDVVRAQNLSVRQRAQAVKDLQDQVDALTAQVAPGNAAVTRLRAAATKLAPTVGTQAVTGSELSVSLDDAKRTAASLPKGYTADEAIGRHFSIFYPAELVARRFPQHELEVLAPCGGAGEEEQRRIARDRARGRIASCPVAALDEVMKGRTTFVVAHRLSAIRHADLVLVLHQSQVVERGTHVTLLARDGRYAQMYRQFVRSVEPGS